MMNNQNPPVIIQQQPTQSISAAGNNMFQAQRVKANEQQYKTFLRGVDAVLQQWTALNLVCQRKNEKNNNSNNNNNAFGVPQVNMFQDQQQPAYDQGPANLMRQDLREMFSEQGEIFSDELEDYFHEFFESERAAWIQDGSLKEVADSLHEMYRRCCADDESVVARFENSLIAYQASGTIEQCVRFNDPENDDIDDDDEDDGDAALQGYDDEGNYVGEDDEEYYEEDDYYDDDNGEYYVDEDGAPQQQHNNSNSVSKGNNKKKGGGGGGWKTMGGRK